MSNCHFGPLSNCSNLKLWSISKRNKVDQSCICGVTQTRDSDLLQTLFWVEIQDAVYCKYQNGTVRRSLLRSSITLGHNCRRQLPAKIKSKPGKKTIESFFWYLHENWRSRSQSKVTFKVKKYPERQWHLGNPRENYWRGNLKIRQCVSHVWLINCD